MPRPRCHILVTRRPTRRRGLIVPKSNTIAATLVAFLAAGCDTVPAAIVGGTFASTANDTASRFFHRATLLSNGWVMVTGGLRIQISPPSLISLNSISFYNPTSNTFSAQFPPLAGGPNTSPTLATARSSHTQTTLLDGRVLIAGGYTAASGTNPGTPVASVEIFNPQTGLITGGPPMASTRVDHTATPLPDGRVVIAGFATWQIFDPTTNLWSIEFPLQHSRNAHAAVLLPDHAGPAADRVLVIAGGGSGSNTLELLNPDAGTSTLLAATLTIGVDDLAATRLDDGRVFIVGGQNTANGDTVNLSYLYDPALDSIAPAPAPPNRAAGISDHQLISTGRFVFISGGEQQVSGTDTELNYAALYDAAVNQWTWQSTMSQVRDDAAAVRLNDGRILLIDGAINFLGNEFPTNTAEICTPAFNIPGDMDNNGHVNANDIAPFVATLTNPASATLQQFYAADINNDARANGVDVQPFFPLLAP